VLRQVPRHRPRPGRAAIAITAAVLVSAAALPALAASPAAQVPATPAAAALPAGFGSASVSTPVLLINGDRLSVRSLAGRSVSAITAAPDHEPLWTLHLGPATYAIPVDAVPYLGRGLDVSLFDVPLLKRLESGGRLPVRLSYDGATPAVPGITITGASDGAATGYLTATSARVFGRALARQFAAGHAAGSYGAAGIFAGVNIGLAGAAVPAPVRPQFPMHTVTVTASNISAKPDNGDEVLLLNADDWETFGDPNEAFNVFYHGSAKFSVPAGHYWALADFITQLKNTFSQRMVVLPQFTVEGDSTTVRVAARAASSEVTFNTPRPATTATVNWTILRYGLHGSPASSGTIAVFGPLWISPTTAKPSAGTIQSYTAAQLFSAAKKGTPYLYNLDFTGPPGVVPAQHFVLTPSSLATVHERFYLNTPSQASPITLGGSLIQLTTGIQIGFGTFLNDPGLQTQYFSGGPSYVWETELFTENAGQSDSFHSLADGQDLTETWGQYPLRPQPYEQLLTGSLARELPQVPSAFRVGNELWFAPRPFSDSDQQFGHVGQAGYNGGYSIRQDGREISSGGYGGYVHATVSPGPSMIRFSLSAIQQQNPLTVLSPSTYTVWTLATSAQPQAVVPLSWECATLRLTPTRRCAVQPMLTLNYQVSGLGLNGVAPAGQQQISVSVGHIQLARAAAIVSAVALVSWDNGQFWYPASVTATGEGSYRVTFNPPAGVNVTLRFVASDAAGGSISETITDAYAVGPSA
jgi:hypothetical protein